MNAGGFATQHETRRAGDLNILDNVRVASPCMVSWATMNGDDRIRHCQECNLNVYNLSGMTRSEAEHLLAGHKGRLCVRFFRRPDGTILTRDCPRGLRALTERVSRIAGAVLTAMMAVAPVFSQAQTVPSSPSQAGDKDSQLGLDVTVLDPTNAVIQNAKVSICRCKEKNAKDLSTDASGVARFRGLAKGSYEITVQAPGFKTSGQTVSLKKPEQVQVKLKIATQTTTVEVKTDPVEVQGTTVGFVTVIQSSLPPIPPSSGARAPLR